MLQGTRFTGNNAANSQGGALVLSGNSTSNVTNSIFDGNVAARGAAIYINGSRLTLQGTNFTLNNARSAGRPRAFSALYQETDSRTYTDMTGHHAVSSGCKDPFPLGQQVVLHATNVVLKGSYFFGTKRQGIVSCTAWGMMQCMCTVLNRATALIGNQRSLLSQLRVTCEH